MHKVSMNVRLVYFGTEALFLSFPGIWPSQCSSSWRCKKLRICLKYKSTHTLTTTVREMLNVLFTLILLISKLDTFFVSHVSCDYWGKNLFVIVVFSPYFSDSYQRPDSLKCLILRHFANEFVSYEHRKWKEESDILFLVNDDFWCLAS